MLFPLQMSESKDLLRSSCGLLGRVHGAASEGEFFRRFQFNFPPRFLFPSRPILKTSHAGAVRLCLAKCTFPPAFSRVVPAAFTP